MKPTVAPNWVDANIAVAWRAVELAHARYIAANTRVDGLVDFTFWTMAMRRLWRIAKAARGLDIPAITDAVDEFQAEVNVSDLVWLRDWWEHADDIGAGVGRTKLRPIQPFDVEGWTAAADRMQLKVRKSLESRLGR